jgi:predicted transcriptional regulator YdeE
MSGGKYAEINLPRGKYVQVEFVKRNHTAAALVVGCIKKVWIELNAYEERNSPVSFEIEIC